MQWGLALRIKHNLENELLGGTFAIVPFNPADIAGSVQVGAALVQAQKQAGNRGVIVPVSL
jgi:hypothetical protein